MKLAVYRKSGQPVNEEAQVEFQKDWTVFYDKADARARVKHTEGQYSDAYNLLMQRYLRYGDFLLHKKHDTQVMEEVPMTAKQWKKLIEKYQETPIAVAMKADGTGLVMIILDEFR